MTDDLRLAVALNGYGLEHDQPDGMWREVLDGADVLASGVLAERLGYERVFTPEISGWETFSLLSAFAGATERIGLGSGIVRISSRAPETLAMAAASLQTLAGGRFALGVGSSESIASTRRRLEALRELLATGHATTDASGETIALATDWASAPPRPVPLILGALGRRMVQLAADVTDGVILNWCTPDRVAEARAAVGSRDDFTIAVYVRACLSHVDDHAVDALKVAAMRYVTLEPYARQFERMGLGPEARRAREAYAEGVRAREAVPDALVGSVCVWGERDGALARLGEYRDAGADLVVVYPVAAGEAVSSIGGTLMALAPDPALED